MGRDRPADRVAQRRPRACGPARAARLPRRASRRSRPARAHRAEPVSAVAARSTPGPPTARRHRDHFDPRAPRSGRAATLMAKPLVRLQVVQMGLAVALFALVLRAAQVQLDARRGALYDRHGTAVALTQETYHLGVAPNELRDPVRDVPAIARQL